MIQDQHLAHTATGEAQATIARGIAHDYLNRLQMVSSALWLIKARAASGRIADVMTLATAAEDLVAQAGCPASDLLALPSPSRYRQERIEVNKVLKCLMPVLATYCGETIDLKLSTSRRPFIISCSRQLLENAIINMIINARDAMSGAGKLTITVSRVDQVAEDGWEDGPPRFAITISDTGCGMSAETRQRVFRPNFTAKAGEKSLGPGLMMVKLFAEDAGGGVALQSAIGGGTSISLLLPECGPRAAGFTVVAG